MSQAQHNANSSKNIPDMTPLSIAFPMNFESANPAPAQPGRASPNPTNQPRPTHRHDAGK